MSSILMGIVGLPNVGKSTLFNALLKKQTALVANYPFATIDPNVGVVEVPDERLPVLAKIVKTEKIVSAIVEFYDIAGLVKGASKGEGLGNQFLSHIREVAAIVHVVRLFDEEDIIHVENKLDPANDIATVEEELMLADLQTLEKQKEPKRNPSKDQILTYEVGKRVKEKLDSGVAVRNQQLTEEEQEHIRQLNLLTSKPVIYCFNCSLEQLEKEQDTRNKIQTILKKTNNQGPNFLVFNPLEENTLDALIKKAYETLSLISFLTAGEKEARAWTVRSGTRAAQAAGTIHTDFEKKFIRADIVPYQRFVDAQGWAGAREKGFVLSAGKDHIMKDGDVVEFKTGA